MFLTVVGAIAISVVVNDGLEASAVDAVTITAVDPGLVSGGSESGSDGGFDEANMGAFLVVDQTNRRWLRYEDGSPFFLCGPGDPEGFLYRGTRNSDGTRGGDQKALIKKLAKTSANGIYMQIIRSHGGDGSSTHNPFIYSDPALGLDEDILDQWETWFPNSSNQKVRTAGFLMWRTTRRR